MNRIQILPCAALLLAPLAALPAADAPQPKPNIVFIFADDWGWGDLSYHGSTWLQTPNLDRLAGEGIDFAQFNVLSPVCSPSRAGVMTGRYPARYSIHQHFASPDSNRERGMPDWLDPRAPSLPRILKQAGYRTGHFGKWHLTNRETLGAPLPEAYGYDEAKVFNGGAGWPSAGVHETADDTVAFIKASAGRPFFINVWLHESHTPHQPTEASMARWKHLDEQKQVYAAVITDGDNAVGKILDALKEAGVEQSTLVLFSSDNGPEHTGKKRGALVTDAHANVRGYDTWCSVGETGGLRGRKRSLFEGGVRVPFLVRWPGHAPAGAKNDSTVFTGVDLLPTLCAAAGIALTADDRGDGENLLEALHGKPVQRTRPIFWQWTGFGGEPDWWPRLAVRDGDWKLLLDPEKDRAELYRLTDDRAESRDLAKEEPERVTRLRRMAQEWKATLPHGPDPACIGKAATADAPQPDAGKARPDLFHKTFFAHPWNETEHSVEGEDWSLPEWVKPAPYSGVQIGETLVGPEFPGRIQRAVTVSWRQLEATEGAFDFAALRQKILETSQRGKYAVKLSLPASVWETRYFVSLEDRTLRKTEEGSAPLWLSRYGIPIREETPNRSIPFQVVNLDIYHPEYHRRYLRLVEAFGGSGIPQMRELDLCYLHLVSPSRGEEGDGPPPGDPRRPLFEQRLRAWAEAFRGVTHKLCLVSGKPDDLQLGLQLGMGQRNGFVEHYLTHAPNPALGQLVDEEGYLVADETCPLIAENRASGDENEEYTKAHVARFGPIETFPHRYRESTLRMLQMRRNFVWAEGGPWLINPPLLHYLTMELGQTVRTAPDAWCYLRESTLKGGRDGRAVKNFERWLYQRDADGARTEATARVEVPEQMFEFHPDHRYDCTARKTRSDEGETRIQLALDDAFLMGGPHRVAVKITYLDCDHAKWQLEHLVSGGQRAAHEVSCGNTGTARTVTFLLNGAFFPETGFRGADLIIRAVQGDTTIRLVRVIKLDPPPAHPGQLGPSATNP